MTNTFCDIEGERHDLEYKRQMTNEARLYSGKVLGMPEFAFSFFVYPDKSKVFSEEPEIISTKNQQSIARAIENDEKERGGYLQPLSLSAV